ncbi:MAG: MGMT family protein [Mariprofundales bacterium]
MKLSRNISTLPSPLFIPCHRIIGSNGKLVGYAGGLQAKKQLLSLESN